MSATKPKILVVCEYYLPGFRSGGGMRTVANTVELLHERFDFRIITRDYDGKRDKTPYATVQIGDWNNLGNCAVFYLPRKSLKIFKIYRLINQVKPDKIYANSFFSPLVICVLILRKFGLVRAGNLIIAPCGELAENALELKSLKKKIFVSLAKILRLNENVVWKASTENEAREIEKIAARVGAIVVAPDLIPKSLLDGYRADLKPEKFVGAARLAFVSRFVKIKNFKWLLGFLHKVDGNLDIDVYGPIEDAEYWRECEAIIKTLPENVKVAYKGAVAHEAVGATLTGYHFFVSPTLSENFGHVFLEALAAGCPLVVSDRTPWRDLETTGIGWDLPLDEEKWIAALKRCVAMNEEEYRRISVGSRKFAEDWVSDERIIKKTENLLENSL